MPAVRGEAPGPMRRGGRSGRAAQRAADLKTVAGVSPVPRRLIPTCELLDAAELRRLEDHADWILEEIGVEFRGDDEALGRCGASLAPICDLRCI